MQSFAITGINDILQYITIDSSHFKLYKFIFENDAVFMGIRYSILKIFKDIKSLNSSVQYLIFVKVTAI